MKITQLFTNLGSGGLTTFTNEYYKGLKLYGCEVKQYHFIISKKSTKAKLIDSVDFDENNYQEYLDDMNSSDYVFIHALPLLKDDKTKTDFYYDLISNKITTKKVLFMNSQNLITYKNYGKIEEIFGNKNFLSIIDYICAFDDRSEICGVIKNTIGRIAFYKKYVHLQHPMTFKDEDKTNWLPFEEKFDRCIYIGRFQANKHPEYLIEVCKYDKNKEFDYEMRGIERTIAVASIPDFLYKMKKTVTGYEKVGPSEYTEYISDKWKKEHNINIEDNMINQFPHEKMYIFGEYKLEEGLEAISKSKFGLECFHLKNKNLYGNNIEYAMFEIVTKGTIPIFDKFTGESIYIEDDDGKMKNLTELKLGLFLDYKCENLPEVFVQMQELKNNKEKYDEMRNRCWKYYKRFSDPLTVITKFFENIKSTETKSGLSFLKLKR